MQPLQRVSLRPCLGNRRSMCRLYHSLGLRPSRAQCRRSLSHPLRSNHPMTQFHCRQQLAPQEEMSEKPETEVNGGRESMPTHREQWQQSPISIEKSGRWLLSVSDRPGWLPNVPRRLLFRSG